MAFLHSNLCECEKSELDLFTLPPKQPSIESSQFVHYKPVSSLSDDGSLEFVVPGGDEYLDLAHTMLSLKVQILRNVATGDVHSLFNQVDVFFNQKIVSPPDNVYPHRVYIDTLLNYWADTIASHLTSSLWYLDNAGNMESLLVVPRADAKANIELLNRQYFTLRMPFV